MILMAPLIRLCDAQGHCVRCGSVYIGSSEGRLSAYVNGSKSYVGRALVARVVQNDLPY